MSVPQGQRTQNKMEVFVKSLDLCTYTIQITRNQKVFPPEYNTAITNEIVHTATSIYMNLWTANNILVKTKEDANRRKELQLESAIQCNNLLGLIQIAQKLFHLSSKRMKFWGEKTIEVRKLIRAWKDSDVQRYKDLK